MRCLCPRFDNFGRDAYETRSYFTDPSSDNGVVSSVFESIIGAKESGSTGRTADKNTANALVDSTEASRGRKPRGRLEPSLESVEWEKEEVNGRPSCGTSLTMSSILYRA